MGFSSGDSETNALVGSTTVDAITTTDLQAAIAPLQKRVFGAVLSTVGEISPPILIPAAGLITKWRIVGQSSGSAVVDVRKSTYADYPTTASIAGVSKPTLVSAQKAESTTLPGWTSALVAGDMLEFVLESMPTLTGRVTVLVEVTLT